MDGEKIVSIIKQELINQMPGYFGVVDTNSKFVMLNQNGLKMTGHKSLDSILESSYCDMKCEAAEFHDKFCQTDRLAMERGKSTGILGYYHYADEWKILLGEKFPLKNSDGDIVAVAEYYTDVSKCNLIDLSRFFTVERKYPVRINKKQIHYFMHESYPETSLSEKQSECLFFLLRGRSTKEIAKMLNLSPRTVETHFEMIKAKLGCLKRSEVIEKAIELGYMNIIPKNLFWQNSLHQ